MATAFGLEYILPLLSDFVRQYPSVLPDWQFDNRHVDLIADGFDAAIGGGFELTPGIVARELARAHIIAVAAPGYFPARTQPQAPADLASIDGIVMRSPQTGRIRTWSMRNRRGDEDTAQLRPRVVFNEPAAICRGAAMGLGAALVSMPDAFPYLSSGALVRILPDWHADACAISLYFADQKLLPAKTRAFVDFVVDQFRAHKLAARFSAA